VKLIRDNLKQIRRKAEDAAMALDPFNYDEFEKDYILSNSFRDVGVRRGHIVN
jgi:hypothetical protein